MNVDIQKLKALAEGAVPGPWECREAEGTSAVCWERGWVADRGTDQDIRDNRFIAAANPAAVLELLAEIERLQRFQTAYKEYSDKTDWVQENAHWSELGMHRADVLRKRCDDAASQIQAQADQLKKLMAENEQMVIALNEILKVTPMGVEAFGIAALVLGELGVSKEVQS